MFDTVLGLPIHALVVHGVVVLLPLMALVTAVVAFVPRLRVPAAWPVAVIDAGMVAMTFVARQSGEALQTRLGGQVAQAHAALGRNLIWFALAMFLVSLVVAVNRRSERSTLQGYLHIDVFKSHQPQEKRPFRARGLSATRARREGAGTLYPHPAYADYFEIRTPFMPAMKCAGSTLRPSSRPTTVCPNGRANTR